MKLKPANPIRFLSTVCALFLSACFLLPGFVTAQDSRMLGPIQSTTQTRSETPDPYFQPYRAPRGYRPGSEFGSTESANQPALMSPLGGASELHSPRAAVINDPSVRQVGFMQEAGGDVNWQSSTTSGSLDTAQVPWRTAIHPSSNLQQPSAPSFAPVQSAASHSAGTQTGSNRLSGGSFGSGPNAATQQANTPPGNSIIRDTRTMPPTSGNNRSSGNVSGNGAFAPGGAFPVSPASYVQDSANHESGSSTRNPAQGNAAQGNAAQGNAAQGNAAQGNAAQGIPAQGVRTAGLDDDPVFSADYGQSNDYGQIGQPGSTTSSREPGTMVPATTATAPAAVPSGAQPTNLFSTGSAQTQPEHNAQDSNISAEAANRESFEPSRVLAVVGGKPIFAGDMMFEINQLIQKVNPTAPESIREMQRPLLMKKLLPKYVDTKILYVSTVQSLPEKASVEKILEQADKEFDDTEMKKMMEEMGVKSPSEFDAQLRMMGSSLRRVRRAWSEDQFVRYFLSQALKVDLEVTHREMLDYYHEHLESYDKQARCRWEQVMVRYDKFPSRQAARSAIEKIGDQIVYGANFAAVAEKESHGFYSSEGGQNGWTTRGAMSSNELDEALFTLPVGELSEIIETGLGLHIVRVIEREEAARTPFLEAQIDIKKTIEGEKREAAFQAHVKKLRDSIPVEIYDEELDAAIKGNTFAITK